MRQPRSKRNTSAQRLLRIDRYIEHTKGEMTTLEELGHKPLTTPSRQSTRARPITLLDDECSDECRARCARARQLGRRLMRVGKLQREALLPAARSHVQSEINLEAARNSRRKITLEALNEQIAAGNTKHEALAIYFGVTAEAIRKAKRNFGL